MTRLIRLTSLACCALAFALLTLGCGTSSDSHDLGGTGGGGSLVFTASSPANGNATLDAPTVLYEPNADGSGLDRLTVTQDVAGISHSFYFYFVPATGLPRSAQHVWGPAGGISQCVAPACVGANAAVDVVAHRVTFTSLLMGEDPLGGSVTSTVSGIVTW